MPIKKDLTDLPSADRPDGRPPSTKPFVADRLAELWFQDYLERGEDKLDRAIPDAGPFRASYASKRCDRALWYALHDVDPTNPPTVADAWRMSLGSMVHEFLQRFMPQLFPGAENEVIIDLNPAGVPGSAHGDVVFTYEENGKLTLVEVKTMGGYQFKLRSTDFRGPATGPRHGDVMQGALAAKAIGAPQLVILYISMELLGADMKHYAPGEVGRFMSEWHFNVEQLDQLLDHEAARIERIIAADEPVPRVLDDPSPAGEGYPEGAVVTDPMHKPNRGLWVVSTDDIYDVSDTGDTWMCAYCWHRDQCVTDGP